jgi:hypothetical protein
MLPLGIPGDLFDDAEFGIQVARLDQRLGRPAELNKIERLKDIDEDILIVRSA